MNIIADQNLRMIKEINEILDDAGAKSLTIKEIDNKDEFGIIVSIPSVLEPKIDPYMLKISRSFKKLDLSISEIFDEINMDLYDLLFLLKQEYLKLIRISKNFNKVIKDNIENHENINTMHIRIGLN